MSGGSMDYLCYKIEEYAKDLEDKELIELARDFAKVFHDAEWYHSDDYGVGTYNQTVREFKEKWLRNDGTDRLERIINDSIKETKASLLRTIGKGSYCKDCANFRREENEVYGKCNVNSSCLMHRYDNACDEYLALI